MSYVFAGAASLLWMAVVARWRMAVGAPVERSLWSVVLCFALAVTLLVDPLRHALVTGPTTSMLYAVTTYAVSVLGCVAARSLVVSTLDQPAARDKRRNAVLAAAAVGAGAVSYLLAPPLNGLYASLAQPPQQTGLTGPFLRSGAFLAYLSWALVGMLRVTRSSARQASSRDLRAGLALGAAGCGLGFGFIALETLVVLAWADGAGHAVADADTAARGVALVSMSLIVAGTIWASLIRAAVRALSAVTVPLRDRHARRRLHPLWAALRGAAPDAAADFAPVVVGGRVRLVRMVVEIRDRQRELRRYLPGDLRTAALVAALAAGYRDTLAAAQAEAAWTEVARQLALAGCPPCPPSEAAEEAPNPVGGRSLDEEVRWLSKVSDTWQTSPFVALFAAETTRRDSALSQPTGVTG